MLDINDSNFESVLAGAKVPVLLVFKASFCGPSAMLDPLIDQVVEDYDGQVIVADIDVEECPKLTKQMQVKGTPGLVIVDMGIPLGSRVGTMPYEDLVAFVEKAICKES